MWMASHSDRKELKRAERVELIRRQTKAGTLKVRRITKAELAALDAAAARRRVVAVPLVDVEPEVLP